MTTKKTITVSRKKWPRHWYNYPIILCGISIQLIWAVAISADPTAMNTTAIHALLPYMSLLQIEVVRWVIVVVLFSVSTLSFVGFCWRKNLHTILSFVPQQFVMFLSAGGAIQAMTAGRFGDGTVRSKAFLIADQSSTLLLAVFHTWAMILILLHGEDKDVQG